ncbi:hypothetical protein D3C73_1571450 [compost metagenome]
MDVVDEVMKHSFDCFLGFAAVFIGGDDQPFLHFQHGPDFKQASDHILNAGSAPPLMQVVKTVH